MQTQTPEVKTGFQSLLGRLNSEVNMETEQRYMIVTTRDGLQALFYYDLVNYGAREHHTTLSIWHAFEFASYAEAQDYVRRAKKRTTCVGLEFEIIPSVKRGIR